MLLGLCLAHEAPPWVWPLRLHSARSLGAELDGDGLESANRCGEEALYAEFLRYSLGEEVLDLSDLPWTPSREEERWGRGEAPGAREGLPRAWGASVCRPTLAVRGPARVCVADEVVRGPPLPRGAAPASFASVGEPRQSWEKEVGGVHQGGVASSESPPTGAGLRSGGGGTRRAEGGL